MSSELIVTSASRGLQAGRSGFTTVLCTRGMHPDLVSRLEAASAYRHVFPHGDPRNPVILSYTSKPSAIGDVWVLSRIGDAGTDYTGRSNKIAHHIALQPADLAALGQSNPAALLSALVASRGLLPKWEGDPRESPTPPRLPSPPSSPSLCERWGSVTGDPGWAGVLVERALNREVTWVIAPAGIDLLELFAEALALVHPAQRWQIPFTTYSLRGDEGRWLGTTAGSPEAEAALAQQRIAVIDLTRRSTATASGPYVLAARGQASVPWQRTAAAAPTAKPKLPTQATESLQAQPTTSYPAPTSSGHTQTGLPPALPRSGTQNLSRTPELMEWEDIPITRPKTGRFVFIATVISTLLLLALVGGACTAYKQKWLPREWHNKIALRLWRSGFGEPPQEVADAKTSQETLSRVIKELEAAVGESDISAHTFLSKASAVLKGHHTALDNLLRDDAALRKTDMSETVRAHVKAKGLLEQFGFLSNDKSPGLLDAHVKAAQRLTDLARVLNAIETTVGKSDITKHPFLSEDLVALQDQRNSLDNLFEDDAALRKIDVSKLTEATNQTKDLIARVRFLMKDQSPELLETHIKAAKALSDSSKQSSSADAAVTKAADALRSALVAKKDKTSLTQLISALKQAPLKDAAKKDANSGDPNLAKSASTTKNTSQRAPTDYAFSLISAAADAAGHLPKQTLLNCEENIPRTLLEWSQEAGVDSLKQVHLYLPDPGGVISETLQLEPLQDKPGRPMFSWQCIAGDGGQRRAIGVFVITDKTLVFERAKGAPADLAGLPFLPLCIATDGTTAIRSEATWVQLMKPFPLKGNYLPTAQELKTTPQAKEPPYPPPVAHVIAIPLHLGSPPLVIPPEIKKLCVLRDVTIAIKAGNNPIQIAPYKTFDFDIKTTFANIPFNSEPHNFWWRPSLKASEQNTPPSGFADLGRLDWEYIDGSDHITLQILWERKWDGGGISGKRQNETVTNNEWKAELEKLADWGFMNELLPKPLQLPHDEKQKAYKLIGDTVDRIFPVPQNRITRNEKTTWENEKAERHVRVDNLTQALRNYGSFRLYVIRVLRLKETAPPTPKQPEVGGLSREDAERKQAEYTNALAAVQKYEKTVKDGCDQDTHLRLWVEEAMTGSLPEPFDDSDLLLMWLWRYLYRVAGAVPITDARTEGTNSRLTWSDVLKAASIEVTGDIVIPWKEDNYRQEDAVPSNCQTLIAAASDRQAKTAAGPKASVASAEKQPDATAAIHNDAATKQPQAPAAVAPYTAAAGGEPQSEPKSANGTNDKTSK